MSIQDYDSNDIKDNFWLHGRLILQKKTEKKAREDAMGG